MFSTRPRIGQTFFGARIEPSKLRRIFTILIERLTMRPMAGRGYWVPKSRCDDLRRFAFIGDSYTFGRGVGPDETFPARSERFLNEVLGSWPAEAVNFGINGYNLWNAWHSFKRVPQVYDGLVFTLCNNDAELFGRTFDASYDGKNALLWEPDHAFHELISNCFDEIAAFVQSQNIFAAICYVNFWGAKDQVRIGEIIGGHCAPRGIHYVDFYSHFAERKLGLSELRLNGTDFHPSPFGYDVMGRYLVRTLSKNGALQRLGDEKITDSAGRILIAAEHLQREDRYPSDITLNWAAKVVEDKRRSASREAAAQESESRAPEFAKASGNVERALLAWHDREQRSVLVIKNTSDDGGIGPLLGRVDDEMLRLEELYAAIECKICRKIPDILSKRELGLDAGESAYGVDEMRKTLSEYRWEISNLVGHVYSASSDEAEWMESAQEYWRRCSDLAANRDLLQRVQNSIDDFLGILGRAEAPFDRVELCCAENSACRCGVQLRVSMTAAYDAFCAIRSKLMWNVGVRQSEIIPLTNVEITVDANNGDERRRCVLDLQLSYAGPLRFPLKNGCVLHFDGTRAFQSFQFPVAFSGRTTIGLHGTGPSFEAKPIQITRVDVYNNPKLRRSFVGSDFVVDDRGRFVSPLFWLI